MCCFSCMVIFYVAILVLLDCFFFKQKTAYEMRISDWSSDVCSSDLNRPSADALMMRAGYAVTGRPIGLWLGEEGVGARAVRGHSPVVTRRGGLPWPSWTTIAHTPEATMRSI